MGGAGGGGRGWGGVGGGRRGGGGGSDPLQLVYYDGNVIMVACTLTHTLHDIVSRKLISNAFYPYIWGHCPPPPLTLSCKLGLCNTTCNTQQLTCPCQL